MTDPRLQLVPWPWDKGQDVLDRDDPWLDAWIAAYDEAWRWT